MTEQKNDKIRTFGTGATRDNIEGKLDYMKALSPIVLRRYVQYLDKHRLQSDGSMRDFDNWKKGIPLATYHSSKGRHFFAAWLLEEGYKVSDNHGSVGEEDALCGELFNTMGRLHEILKKKIDGTPLGYGSKDNDLIDKIFGSGIPTVWAVQLTEENESEEFEGFAIKLLDKFGCGWYAVNKNNRHLWKDLTLQPTTGFSKFCDEHNFPPKHGEAPGYYKTKDEARDTIRAYKDVSKWVVRHNDGSALRRRNNWYIGSINRNEYLHSDFTSRRTCLPLESGYYPTKEIAEAYLKAYKEKHNVAG